LHLPLDDIKDGYEFQQLVAAYFRSLKSEKHEYHIADVDVDDNGIGTDGGVDIIVEFHYSDVITKHSYRWIIECKCWDKKRRLSLNDIDTNNVLSLLKSKKAQGYLLVCKGNATNNLKQRFRELTERDEKMKFEIWEGTRFWQEVSQRENLLKAFFSSYYQDNFINNNAKEEFDSFVKKFEEKFRTQ
jgi:hypothetical protein